jgi:hypothetical protein
MLVLPFATRPRRGRGQDRIAQHGGGDALASGAWRSASRSQASCSGRPTRLGLERGPSSLMAASASGRSRRADGATPSDGRAGPLIARLLVAAARDRRPCRCAACSSHSAAVFAVSKPTRARATSSRARPSS